jgi:UDP-2,3-diacylglucosamine pyrophosphatase LpxH
MNEKLDMTETSSVPKPADFLTEGASVIEQLAQSVMTPAPRTSSLILGTQSVRALFISDLHLGSKGCRARDLISFLRQYRTNHLYLVGDVFDTWRPMGKNWTRDHDNVVRAILDMYRAGAKLTYLPGNHDALFHRFHGHHFGAVTITRQAMHTTADGQRLLVIHGDSCDVFADTAPWLARIGATLESGMRYLHDRINFRLTRAGRPQWRGIEDIVNIVNQAVRKHDRFEERLSALARRCGADGIVCGHFHQPALHRDFGVTYANCGDWVENQTAIVETEDGSLRLINWARPTASVRATDPELGQEEGLAAAN